MVPEYHVINTEGPDHKRRFFVNVTVKKEIYGPGIGESKKQAEQHAARIAMHGLKKWKRLRDHTIEEIKGIKLKNEVKIKKFARDGKRSKDSSKDA